MQGIIRNRHEHLKDALIKVEKLLSHDQQMGAHSQQAAEYRQELENMHQNYVRLLGELAAQIDVYESLYTHVKIHFLARKLKELKRSPLR